MLIDCIQSYKEKQFAIVLADTDRDGAAIVAERLRSLVENHFQKSPETVRPKALQ